jgi:ketol-acid reductoisomerase
MENVCGRPKMRKWVEAENAHLIEKVGQELRDMMPWMESKQAPEV